jgi:hypothetical protein
MTPDEYANKRASDRLFGFPIREKLYPEEDQFFSDRPEVAGMAAEDNAIIINPYSPLPKKQLGLVAENEALRLKMRQDEFSPNFEVTPDQVKFFEGTEYADNPTAMKQTILARIYSGDPSAKATPEQKQALKKYLSKDK